MPAQPDAIICGQPAALEAPRLKSACSQRRGPGAIQSCTRRGDGLAQCRAGAVLTLVCHDGWACIVLTLSWSSLLSSESGKSLRAAQQVNPGLYAAHAGLRLGAGKPVAVSRPPQGCSPLTRCLQRLKALSCLFTDILAAVACPQTPRKPPTWPLSKSDYAANTVLRTGAADGGDGWSPKASHPRGLPHGQPVHPLHRQPEPSTSASTARMRRAESGGTVALIRRPVCHSTYLAPTQHLRTQHLPTVSPPMPAVRRWR